MKQFFYISGFVALFSALFLMGFSPQGDKVPSSTPVSYEPNEVLGPVVENPPNYFYESFESNSFPPAGWRKFNPIGGNGWNRQTAGTSPIPGWNGGVVTTPHNGQSAIAFCTWNTSGQTSTDQWLVTPQITVNNSDSLSFWVKYPGFSHNFQDFLEIRISTTTPDMGSFYLAHTLFWAAGTSDTNWRRRSFKLTSFPGVTAGSNIYIAFREKVSNNYNEGGSIFLDIAEVETLTGVQFTGSETPDGYSLSQNYPNPFNPSTSIDFSIVDKGLVSLKVYDMTGKEVGVPVNEVLSAGSYSYSFDGSGLNSGVYFYRLQTEGFTSTKKMMLVK